MQISRKELEQRLTNLPDTEFDQQDNIVGWGLTLVPTAHQFQIGGQSLYTWCAFDTLLFPPFLQAPARVFSICPITRHPITFVSSPEGEVKDLTPASKRQAEEVSAGLPKEIKAEAAACYTENWQYAHPASWLV